MQRLTAQTWWIAAACAAWALVFLADASGPVRILVPCAFFCALLLTQRSPVTAAALVGLTQGTGLLLGAPQDNLSGLAAGLTALFLLGLRATVARGAPAYAVCAAVIVATDGLGVRVVWGVLLFAAVWLAGVVVRRRSDAARAAAAKTVALTSVDPRERIASITAAERERLGEEAVAVIRACLVRVAEVARAAHGEPSPQAMTEIRRTGGGAIDRLRSLLVLLRGTETRAAARAADSYGRPDLELVGAVAALALIDCVATDDPTVVGVAVLVTAVFAVLLRERTPALACLALAVPLLVAVARDEEIVPGMGELAAYGLVAWSVVGARRVAAWGALALLAGAALLADRGLPASHTGVVAATFVAGAVAAGAWHPQARRQREADRTAEAYEDQVRTGVAREIAAERRRMARDLHDLVSGSVGAAVVHANAAEALADVDPAAARAAVDQIIAAIARAQGQLDLLQGALAGVSVVPSDAAGMRAELERLAAEATTLGLVMTLAIGTRVDDARLAPVIVRAAREAVGNAAKYAPGSSVVVTVGAHGPYVDVEIVDDGPAAGTTLVAVGTGSGLRGLAERAEAVGGWMESGPRGGGFAVRVRLPRGEAHPPF